MPKPTTRAEFDGSQGKLAAALELPAGRPRAFALFAHCFSCTKDIKSAREIARALREDGIAVLRFDFTGLGGSEGDFANTNFSSNVDDLVKAAEFLRREFEAPAILIGHSLGGAAALVAAEKIPEAQCVVTINAPAQSAHVAKHLKEARAEIEANGEATVELAGRPFKIKKQLLDDLDTDRVIAAAGALDRPLLVLHAPRDETVGVENATKIFIAARHPKSFVSLDTADHLLSDSADARYAAAVIAAWSGRYIAEAAAEEDDGPDRADALDGGETEIIADKRYAVAASAGGHAFTIDADKDDGGDGLGPNPTRLVEAALAGCSAITMRMYAERKGWTLSALRVVVDRAPGEDAHAASVLRKTVAVEGDLDADQRRRLHEIGDKCPVHRMLTRGVTIESALE